MALLDVFDYVFQNAHPSKQQTLPEVLRSPEYADALEGLQRCRMVAEDCDEGIALRAGHLAMTGLLSRFSEQEALMHAAVCEAFAHPDDELLALTAVFGSKLVEGATACLPESVIRMAKEWKTAPADRQLEITRELLIMFQSESQGEVGYHAPEEARINKMWEDEIRQRAHNLDIRSYLPRLYGPWDSHKNPANCQGKTQMLTVFARLAGARVFCALPATDIGHARTDSFEKVVVMIRDDLKERGLYDVDVDLKEGIEATLMGIAMDKLRPTFHVAVIIELRDNRWVMVDPHGRSWGVLSNEWNMPQMVYLLEKYGRVLPGLIVQASDHGRAAQEIQDLETQVQQTIERSREVENELKEVDDLMTLTGYISESPGLPVVAEFINAPPEYLDNPEFRGMLCASIAHGTTSFDELFSAFFDLGDHEKLEVRKKSWITVLHAAAQSRHAKAFNLTQMVHPACDFGLPEWHLAVAALNPAEDDRFGVRWGRIGGISRDFLPRISSDQTTIRNLLLHDRESDLARAAEQTLASLQFKHAICQKLNL